MNNTSIKDISDVVGVMNIIRDNMKELGLQSVRVSDIAVMIRVHSDMFEGIALANPSFKTERLGSEIRMHMNDCIICSDVPSESVTQEAAPGGDE